MNNPNRPLVEPVISFQEYVLTVLASPQRHEELKVLVELFGMQVIERIAEGKSNANPIALFQKGRTA